MPARKFERKKEETENDEAAKGLPPEFRSGEMHRPTTRGRIPVSAVFEGIYQTAAKGEAKKAAPEEVAQLKVHLDGALKQLQAITRKLEEKRD